MKKRAPPPYLYDLNRGPLETQCTKFVNAIKALHVAEWMQFMLLLLTWLRTINWVSTIALLVSLENYGSGQQK